MEQPLLPHPRGKTASLMPLSFFARSLSLLTLAIAERIFTFALIGLPPI
jgi:hypothetical protein